MTTDELIDAIMGAIAQWDDRPPSAKTVQRLADDIWETLRLARLGQQKETSDDRAD